MTHDELLEKIDSKVQVCTCDGWNNNCWEDDNKPWVALRAVVELHKPRSDEKVCIYCSRSHFWIAYPCPTIQPIEKELK